MMMRQKFKPGDSVEIRNSRRNTWFPTGSFSVVRLLPQEGASHRYRLKSKVDGREYAIDEGNLVPTQSL